MKGIRVAIIGTVALATLGFFLAAMQRDWFGMVWPACCLLWSATCWSQQKTIDLQRETLREQGEMLDFFTTPPTTLTPDELRSELALRGLDVDKVVAQIEQHVRQLRPPASKPDRLFPLPPTPQSHD
jgi:hypothetical protein